MADLEQLKQKYQPVLHTLEIEGAQVTNLGLDVPQCGSQNYGASK